MQLTEVMELDVQETECVSGGACDSIRSCAEAAGRAFANALEDIWDNPSILIA